MCAVFICLGTSIMIHIIHTVYVMMTQLHF